MREEGGVREGKRLQGCKTWGSRIAVAADREIVMRVRLGGQEVGPTESHRQPAGFGIFGR